MPTHQPNTFRPPNSLANAYSRRGQADMLLPEMNQIN